MGRLPAVASFQAWDITREDIDYMISLGKDDVGQAWEDLEIIAKAEMKMDGADPMDPSLERCLRSAASRGKLRFWCPEGGY